MNIVILGLSITSSWGNGHATTFRSLVKELNKNGHRVLFLERDVAWYAQHRDLPNPDYCRVELYKSLDELTSTHEEVVKSADLVIVGSYVPEGVAVGKWVIETAKGIKAFYDIDTPVTLAKLEKHDYEYVDPELISAFDLYLSFTGGAVLDHLEDHYHSPMARPLYCSFDPELYYPEEHEKKWDLGYLGTYSDDRQPVLKKLLLDAAENWRTGKFVVAGPQYPDDIKWPENVEYIPHLPRSQHREFYNSQNFTLNVTRADMKKWGYAPSVRLFEAAACATPIISDNWQGLDSFFELETEILIAYNAEDTLNYFDYMNEEERQAVGERARQKVLENHTAAHRAKELENYVEEAMKKQD